jgi:cation:H+ antiporter
MSGSARRREYPIASLVLCVLAVLGNLPWLLVRLLGLQVSDVATALITGSGILAAAFLLSWAVEIAEMDLPQALAVSILALVAVMPEYAVDATFAWEAARDPAYMSYAVANMTGANRLLIGLGWSSVVFVAWLRFGKKSVRLPGTYGLDISILLLASAYAIVPVLKGTLSVWDSAVLVALYVLYIWAAARSGSEEEPELVGPSRLIARFGPVPRRLAVAFFFGLAAVTIFFAAEPFSHSLVDIGGRFGIDQFILVQWVAPLASETPEFVVAMLLVLNRRSGAGIRTLVSSEVNQWTLLVGTLAIVFSISAGHLGHLVLDSQQREEVALTAAQSVFAIVVVADGELSLAQALMLCGLFLTQLFLPFPAVRWAFTALYGLLAAGLLVKNRRERMGIVGAIHSLYAGLLGRSQPEFVEEAEPGTDEVDE